MKIQTSSTLGLASLTTATALLFAACERQGAASFTSAELAERSRTPVAPTNTANAIIGQRDPIILKIPGTTDMMAIAEKDNLPLFFRTFSGYATTASKVSVDVGKIITLGMASADIGGGISYVESTPYIRLTPLQALALFRNDLDKLLGAAREEVSTNSNSVHPSTIERLRILITPPKIMNTSGESATGWIEGRKLLQSSNGPGDFTINGMPFDSFFDEQSRVSQGEVPRIGITPLYLNLGDGLLLGVTQRFDDKESTLTFSKTSSGLAASGFDVDLAVARFGNQKAVGNIYLPISPGEAKALCDGSWQVIYNAAMQQYDCICSTVIPATISLSFKGKIPFVSEAFKRFQAREAAKATEEAVRNSLIIQQSTQYNQQFNQPFAQPF